MSENSSIPVALPPTPFIASRLGMLAVFAAVTAAIVSVLAQGPAATIIASMAITQGSVLIAWLLAGFGLGCAVLKLSGTGIPACVDRSSINDGSESQVRMPVPLLDIVTATALGLGAISLLTLLLGVAGILNQYTAIALPAIGDFLAIAHIYKYRARWTAWLREPAGVNWLLLFLSPVAAIVVIGTCILPGLLWGLDDPSGYDVLAYHLQLPREWYELGRVTTLDHNVFSFFPLNVEMHYLLAMHVRGGPWAGMYLAQMMHGAFIALTVCAVYALAARHGKLAATVAAIVCASVPWMWMLGSVAYVEGGLMLYLTLAAGWAMRGRWALAGICAGLACGCKLTGVPASAVIAVACSLPRLRGRARVGVSAGAQSLGNRNAPHPGPPPQAEEGDVARRFGVARDAFAFSLAALLVFSPWLVRTAIASGGNPIFPLALHTLGHGHFDAGQIERFETAHSPRSDQRSLAGRFAGLWQQVIGDEHFGAIKVASVSIPLWLASLAIAVLLARRNREAISLVLIIVGSVAVWLFATHLQGRFLVQIIPFIALLTASAVGVAKRFATVAVIIAVLTLIGSAVHPLQTLLRSPGPLDAIGVTDAKQLQSLIPDPQIAQTVYDTDRPIALLGDAKAFWYAIPMARLRYRSVFDVGSNDFRDGWLGPDVPADAAVCVDRGDLDRFYRTYVRLPAGVDRLPARAVIRVEDVPR